MAKQSIKELHPTVLLCPDGFSIRGLGCGWCYIELYAIGDLLKQSVQGAFWPYKIIVTVWCPLQGEFFVEFADW